MNLAHELFGEPMVTDLLKEASNGEHPPTYGVFDVDPKTGKKIPRGKYLDYLNLLKSYFRNGFNKRD